MEIPSTVTRLLTRLFLRRFLENDLISSESDRHESLALICGGLASLSLFVAAALCVKYLFGPPLPGAAAIALLSDRFFFITTSMVVTALATLLVWDALGLEARDEAVLGPLPIRRRTLVRAKYQALMGFLSTFALALNVVPSVVHPLLLLSKFHQVSVAGLLWLIAVHAFIVLMGAAFGFFAVLGVRGLLQSVLPGAWFARASVLVQGVLVVGLVSILLLLPTQTSNVPRDWLSPPGPQPGTVPTLWFLGAYETAAGGVIANIPRAEIPQRLAPLDMRATAVYRTHEPLFRRLAPLAFTSSFAVAFVAVAAYLWNSRRPRSLGVRPMRPGIVRRAFAIAVRSLVVRRPLERAGFFFALQTLARSGPHRLVMSAALACGLTGGILILQRVGFATIASVALPSTRLLAVQSMLVVLLMMAFRHAVRLPADLQARWTIELGWTGDIEGYLRGVMRAATTVFNVFAAIALFPVYWALLGTGTALVHLVLQVAFGVVLLEALFVNARTVPFACSYISRGHLGVIAPRVVAVALLTFGFARVERYALAQPNRTILLLAILIAAIAVLRIVAKHLRRRGSAMLFDDVLEPPTQRLELSG